MAAGANLLLLLTLVISGQVAADEVAMSLRPTHEIDFNARGGQVFELQGSDNLQSWADVGDVVFGQGDRVSDFVPVGGGFSFYRVKFSPAASFGFAPKHLLGKQLEFNGEGEAESLAFLSRASGADGRGSFAYNYRQLGDTTARLVIDHSGPRSERFELNFRADLVGSYTRTMIDDGATMDIDRGTFTLRTPNYPSPDPLVNVIPDSLVGLTYLFDDGDNHERLDFVGSNDGRAISGVEIDYFAYNSEATTDSGTITVRWPEDVVIEYVLRSSEGSRCGSYMRTESIDGALVDVSEGVYSSAESVYHAPGATSTEVTLPADSLSGRTYVMRDGGTPCRLEFIDLLTGECTEGARSVPFEFEYNVTCSATSSITLRFGAEDYDEYHLNHTDGIFLRHEVRGGQRVDSDTGSFLDSTPSPSP